MKKTLLFILLNFLLFEISNADFKKIKKKAVVNNPEIIFPLPKDLKGCRTEMRINPKYNKVTPIIELDAPEGYGLDERFSEAGGKFGEFSIPCSTGNKEACTYAVKVLLDWAKAGAAKRIGPNDEEGKYWNDTLTVNLFIASPMMAAYSFAKQVINVPDEDDKIIKEWFKKNCKKKSTFDVWQNL